MNREVPRLLLREVGVRLMHALHGVVDGGIGARHPAREAVGLRDPFLHALGRGLAPHLRHLLPAWPQSLDRHHLCHLVRVHAGVFQGDGPAQGVPDDRDRLQVLLGDELGDVVDVVDHGVAGAVDPLRVPVSAQIGGDDVVVVAQGLRHPVPVAAVVASAVDEEQGRLLFVPPVDIM